MTDQKVAELGTVVVFDAQHMTPGMQIVVSGLLCEIESIDGERVNLKAVRGWPLLRYKLSTGWSANKYPISATTVVGGLIYLIHHYHLMRLLF